jgi:hypothetical protein
LGSGDTIGQERPPPIDVSRRFRRKRRVSPITNSEALACQQPRCPSGKCRPNRAFLESAPFRDGSSGGTALVCRRYVAIEVIFRVVDMRSYACHRPPRPRALIPPRFRPFFTLSSLDHQQTSGAPTAKVTLPQCSVRGMGSRVRAEVVGTNRKQPVDARRRTREECKAAELVCSAASCSVRC